jgi:hypothetical protein
MRKTPVQVNSFEEFKTYISQNSNGKNTRLFRGQENAKWDLNLQLFRLVEYHEKIEQLYDIEKNSFKNFKQEVSKINTNFPCESDWNLLSIAQHHKLPTRLIDWTTNALIALWFAFKDPNKKLKFRSVWGLYLTDKHKLDPDKDELFRGRFIKIFEPNKIDTRIEDQESWFSIQKMEIFKNFGGDGLPTFNKYNIINQEEEFDNYLIQIKIPNFLRKNILKELKKASIDQSSLSLNYENDLSRKLELICMKIKNKYFN